MDKMPCRITDVQVPNDPQNAVDIDEDKVDKLAYELLDERLDKLINDEPMEAFALLFEALHDGVTWANLIDTKHDKAKDATHYHELIAEDSREWMDALKKDDWVSIKTILERYFELCYLDECREEAQTRLYGGNDD